MPFSIDFNWASQAIMEQEHFVFMQGPPPLPPNGLGPVELTDLGNGRWHHTSSYYYNCGANNDFRHAPPIGDIGQLTLHDGYNLEGWFWRRYPNLRPHVLKDEIKWNFTLVYQGSAFNFHVLVYG